jgi:HD-GYP domain-containing protein (c-di-GMP phosphodiesterase class II)
VSVSERGPLHDTDKLGVSNYILDKPRPLTHAEYAQVKKHPGLIYDTLVRVAPSAATPRLPPTTMRSWTAPVITWRNRQRPELPSRILAVADVFDALSQ